MSAEEQEHVRATALEKAFEGATAAVEERGAAEAAEAAEADEAEAGQDPEDEEAAASTAATPLKVRAAFLTSGSCSVRRTSSGPTCMCRSLPESDTSLPPAATGTPPSPLLPPRSITTAQRSAAGSVS